jgi:hypothetical protein
MTQPGSTVRTMGGGGGEVLDRWHDPLQRRRRRADEEATFWIGGAARFGHGGRVEEERSSALIRRSYDGGARMGEADG